MHYLITGGCGFVGSHLARKLRAGGHSLTIVDDLSTGKRENLPAGARLIEGDITTPGIFDDAIGRIDGCFHLAAIVSVQRSNTEWRRTHAVNIGGTVALFDAIARHEHHIPVVLASSAAVYGNCGDHSIKETADTAPLSAYGADKLACELHAAVAAHVHSIPTTSLRFFNVYGPGQDPASPYSGVISVFMQRLRERKALTIYGDGKQTRDFIYVGDVVEALRLSMDQLRAKKRMHGVFNVCTGKGTSINHLAELAGKVAGAPPSPMHVEARAADIRHSTGDAAHALKTLGFQAQMALREGLAMTYEAL